MWRHPRGDRKDGGAHAHGTVGVEQFREGANVEIIYDGDCGICTASVRWLAGHDRDHVLAMIPSSALDAAEREALPIDRTVIVRSDGRTVERSEAVATALAALPDLWGRVGRSALALVALGPLRRVGDAAYDFVAEHRSTISAFLVRHGKLDTTCAVPHTRP